MNVHNGNGAMRKPYWLAALALNGLVMSAAPVRAQQSQSQPAPGAPSLTLRQAVAQAVERSRDVAVARLRYQAAQRESDISRSQFMPNLYAGSGAAYTSGFPLAAGGGAPAIVSVTYSQTLFDPMIRSEVHASEQREQQMRLSLDAARDAVIARVASAYLELAKSRRSRDLLISERASAARILNFMRQRADAGLELPIEVTRAQLTAAKIEQSIARLENGAGTLDEQLRADLGLAAGQPLEVAAEDLPAVADPETTVVERAVQSSIALKQAASERDTTLAHLQGERGSRWPTISLTGQYNVLAKFNSYDEFFNKFQRNNVLAGVQIKIPIFASRNSSGIAAAQTNFSAAQMAFDAKRSEVSIDARQKARQRREMEAAREVARLDLELAQQNTGVVQAQFNQGRASLRDLEGAQMEQNDKWLAFLDADFALQQAQLALMRATGQIGQLAQ